MKLSKLLTKDQILLNMKAVSQHAALAELVDHLVNVGLLPGGARQTTLDALTTREELVSTGIGSGVAIPHAFSDDLEKVITIFGRSEQGIEFESLDNAPVHHVVLFIVPRKDYHMHLRTLSAIAKMFGNQEILQRLAAAQSCDEILAILGAKKSCLAARRA